MLNVCRESKYNESVRTKKYKTQPMRIRLLRSKLLFPFKEISFTIPEPEHDVEIKKKKKSFPTIFLHQFEYVLIIIYFFQVAVREVELGRKEKLEN